MWINEKSVVTFTSCHTNDFNSRFYEKHYSILFSFLFDNLPHIFIYVVLTQRQTIRIVVISFCINIEDLSFFLSHGAKVLTFIHIAKSLNTY